MLPIVTRLVCHCKAYGAVFGGELAGFFGPVGGLGSKVSRGLLCLPAGLHSTWAGMRKLPSLLRPARRFPWCGFVLV